MKIAKHFSLVKEHPDHYEINNSKTKTTFNVAKRDLDLKAHKNLAGIRHYDEGTDAGPVGSPGDVAQNNFQGDWNPAPANAQYQPPASISPSDLSKVNPSSGYMPDPSMFGSGTVPIDQPQVAIPDGLKLSSSQQSQVGMPEVKPDIPLTQESGPAQKPEPTPYDKFLSNQKTQEGAAGQLAKDYREQGQQMADQQDKNAFVLQGALERGKQDADAALWKANTIADGIAKSTIDPQRYVGSMSTTNKIWSAIAIGLGGIGAGLSGQPNQALKILDDEIGKDIDAQKANLGKQQSLYSNYLQQYGDVNRATQATQMSLNAIAQGQIAKIAALSGGKINADNASQMMGALKNDNMMKASAFKMETMKQNLIQQASSGNMHEATDPATLVPYMVPEHHQAKAYDIIEAADNTAKNGPKVLKAFDDAYSGHTKDYVPGMENSSIGAYHSLLGPTFKDVEQTTRQSAMDNFFHANSPAPLSDNANDRATKRKALIDYLSYKQSAPLLKAYHIDLSQFASTRTNFGAPEGTTATNPQTGEKAVFQNGKWSVIGKR